MTSGAMALFGEKYGDQVRVVSVGDWARELCGGTHAGRSGQLGVIKLLGESSIGSGVRRVEALVGSDAYRFLAREHVLVAQLTEALKARPEELPERVNDMVERLRAAEKEIERVRVGSCSPPAASSRPARPRSAGSRRRPPRRRRRRRRRAQARARRPRPAARGRARRRGRHRRQRRQGRPWSSRSTTRRGRGADRQRAGPRRRAAGRRQGRRQGRRRPGRRRRRLARSTRRWRWSQPRSAGSRAGEGRADATRRAARHRRRRRPHRRRPQRPVRASSRPRSRPCAAARATWPGSRRSSPRRRGRRGRRRAAPVAVRAARARRRRRCASSRAGSPAGGAGAGAAVDERLTTVSAEAMLRDQGRKGGKRRAVVDQAAAVVILQNALDTERATGAAPGEIVEETSMTDEHDQYDGTTTCLARRRRRRRHSRSTTSRRAAAVGGAKRRSVPGCLAVLVALAVLVGGFYFVVSWGIDALQDQFELAPRTTRARARGRVIFEVEQGDTVADDRPQPEGAGRRRLGRGVHRRRATPTRSPTRSRSASTS